MSADGASTYAEVMAEEDRAPAEGETADADVAELSYEQARDQLVELVGGLEGGQVPLAESMRLWQRGEALAAHCTSWLDRAEQSLTGDDGPSGDGGPGTAADED